MSRLPQIDRSAGRPHGRLLAGLLLCALVALFSLAAKVSWYQTSSSGATSISKQKAFKAELPMSPPAASIAVLPGELPMDWMPVLLALVASLLVVEAMSQRTQSASRNSCAGFVRAWAARPPPTR